MRIAVNLVIILIIGFLAYMLIGSIREPIKFMEEKDKREKAVIDKLRKIRTLEEHYRGITGEFAGNFDSLKHVLRTGSFKLIKVIGDPDDPEGGDNVTYDTSYRKAIDSLKTLGLIAGLDSIQYIPYSNGKSFNIAADTTTYQSTLVQVVEVGASRKDYMGPYADDRFKKYDNNYDPRKIVKFGSLSSPNLAGNWE
ncbi:MAG: hypothetical protein KDC24_03575 [Saprospiraceae bacterium]|nr:hypothetical protein [Saprospiraceae bacterium]